MTNSLNPAVDAAVNALPIELQTAAARWFERFALTYSDGEIRAAMIAPLVRLVAASEFGAHTAMKDWQWLVAQDLCVPPDRKGLDEFVRHISASEEAVEIVQREIRQYRNRYLLHILWRELNGNASVTETLAALTALADRLLAAACVYAERQLHERYGVIRNPEGQAVSLVVLGMGKLGGNELNFSSDIDLVFLYPSDGESDGDRSLSAPEYFARVIRHISALLEEVTSDGFAFRIDTRLRPFGDSGPPAVSFAALESYLTQHGRDWERYAYIKARVVGPQPPASVVHDLYGNVVAPFVYRRYLDFGVFESLRAMQALIAQEVRQREMADNVKLGPGGIREIEFIVQSLQLVRGGSRTDLQERSLQTVLPRLAGHDGMSNSDVAALDAAYRFLRRTENFIQAIRDQQTHELPLEPIDRERLSFAMGYADWAELASELQRHRDEVTRQFDRIAFRSQDRPVDDGLKARISGLWERRAAAADWSKLFVEANCAPADELGALVAAFASSRAVQQIDVAAARRLGLVMPEMLLLLRSGSAPLDTLQHLLDIIVQILRRSAYLSLLNENKAALARLVTLCEQSGFVAEQIARYPVLLDELLDPRIYTARITRAGLERELQYRVVEHSLSDDELQMEALARFQRASQFRIAVADINDSLPIMRVSDSLTDVAECVLVHALRVAWADLTSKHGVPRYRISGEHRRAGFGIIGYGKLGGIEMSYTSDLDLVFLHDSHGDDQRTDGERPLDNAMFFLRLVRRLLHYLTTQTASGMLYEVDMRLRPDGRSGLLVTTIDAFERYQDENAWTWEHQALLRARPVAGSAVIGREFERVRAETLIARVRRDALRDEVVSMRRRMRKQLDKSDQQQFDLKQGSGGIGDIEFIVQYLVLANASDHPAVIHYPDNVRQLATLAAAGCLTERRVRALQDIYRGYRLRLHRLSLDEQRSLVAATEFAKEREAVMEIWSELFGR